MQIFEQKLTFSKKNQREVTAFVGHELLYDYICNCLDEERKQSVEKFINSSSYAKQDLKKIEKGLEYAEQLAHTIVAQPIIEKISEPSTYLSELLKKSNYDKWPISVKWGIEALIVVTVIASFLIIVPWDRAMQLALIPHSKEVTLAEVMREQKVGDPDKLKEIEKNEPAQFEDDELKKDKNNVASTDNVKNEKIIKTATSEKTQQAIVKNEKQKTTQSTAPAATDAVSVEKKSESKKVTEGFLYRGVMKAANVQVIGPQIRDKIVELGGRKAGEVELGWNKTTDSAYYHFTIPESKLNDLNKFLSGYGKAKLNKEKHPRVMPDGIIRLILTIEESSK